MRVYFKVLWQVTEGSEASCVGANFRGILLITTFDLSQLFFWLLPRDVGRKRRREIMGGEVCLAIRRQENLTTCWYHDDCAKSSSRPKFQTISWYQKIFPETFFLQKFNFTNCDIYNLALTIIEQLSENISRGSEWKYIEDLS